MSERSDDYTPEQFMVDMLQAQKAMAGEYVCTCGTHGDDAEAIEACADPNCYFRDDNGEIDAPYKAFPEIDTQIAELEEKIAGGNTTSWEEFERTPHTGDTRDD